MPDTESESTPVKAKAYVVDPRTNAVVWMNESALEDVPEHDREMPLPVSAAVPVADALGLLDALREVAASGRPSHVRVDLVSMSRGSITIVASVYRLPDGNLLLLMEHGFQASERKGPERDVQRHRPGRR